MQGFSAVNDSSFHKALEEIDTTIGINSALGFTASTTRVMRIGREGGISQKLSKKVVASVLAARRPQFYNEMKGQWPKISSSIEQFVSKDPTSVDILISDLEPDDASIKQVVSAIKPKLEFDGGTSGWLPWRRSNYHGNELAIIGIRSMFAGGVYPAVQGAFKSFPYTGLRPFYILALGPTDKVEKIVDRLAKNKELAKSLQVSRFSSNPNSGKTEFIEIAKTSIAPASCLVPVFTLSQGLSGKLNVQNPNRWLLSQKQRGCANQQAEIRFGSNPIIGFGAGKVTDSTFFLSTNSSVTGAVLSENETYISTRFTTFPGIINIIDISVDAARLDQERWADWNTSGTRLDGARTQRLLALIQSIRGETDQFAFRKFKTLYSPARICSAVKG
ncbi:hypothetical protein KBY58_00335 [Cyanobium sp. HWJ4-Hawea]|uniref:hypothetical protein n=1 Tax=Cyanobium sp. HWJ4-Hawea TaxID=2823713 RepID=UPI0020CBCFBE|nr:hypothetical protein [Cyanobium sp. HWJ4-Hawea]MCP9807883.1 hypothetical protein [Cyanobium sp. HWJ4-Hawea]